MGKVALILGIIGVLLGGLYQVAIKREFE
jgi:hypothetical protein